MLSAVYSAVISTPPLIYGCTWCPLQWRVLGALSILLLFTILHLVEALVYVVTRWKSVAGLISGVIFSLLFLFDPSMLVDLTAIDGLSGVKVPLTTLLEQLVVALLLSAILYIAVARVEKC